MEVQPRLLQISGGWLAMAPTQRWAVRGKSQEEAVEEFRKAERRHREMKQRPEPNYERFEP
jgi:hypothetical protein